jgi:hypothetical protein
MLSNKDLLQKPSASARAPRFEAIWEKTKGTDFDKTLAMLKAYCETKNWGTHSKSVWSVVEQYVGSMLSNGYCKTVKDKNVLIFKIEFLLLQLSEDINFNKIKVEGDLAAIFHVIFTHTNINAYDFSQGTELYAAYEEQKKEIKNGAFTASDWMDLLRGLVESYRYESYLMNVNVYVPCLAGALLSAKSINYMDSWKLIAYPGLCEDVYATYNMHCTISDEDFSELFHSEEIQDHPFFIGYLYCKKYNLDFDCLDKRPDSVLSSWVNMVYHLCAATKEKIDGALLLHIINIMQKKGLLQPAMLIKLIEKRRLFENWNDLENILIDNNKLNFFNLLHYAIEDGLSVDTVRYLLEEKRAEIDIKSLSKMSGSRRYFNYDLPKTLIQVLIASISHEGPSCHGFTFEKHLEILKMLIRHDPYCVCIKDKNGNDIFHYLHTVSESFNDFLKSRTFGKEKKFRNLKKPVDDFFEGACSIIRNAFHRKNACTFFSERNKKDSSSNISLLPEDVLRIICAYTIDPEISELNSDDFINPENRAAPI